MNSKGIIFFTENVVKDDCLLISLFNAEETKGQFKNKGKVKKVYPDRVVLRVSEGNEVTVSFNDIISYTKL